jgi:ribonuclease VapC
MVLDTSAIVAVIFDEPEREAFLSLIARNPTLSVSALTFYETSIVAFGKKPDPLTTRSIESFLDEFLIEVVSADADAA